METAAKVAIPPSRPARARWEQLLGLFEEAWKRTRRRRRLLAGAVAVCAIAGTNLEAVLAASGASLDDVIRVGVFLTDLADFEGLNDVYRATFKEPYPARTTVYVGLPGRLRVEIDALAAC